MFYFVYETTNNVNGKKYRGVHKTKNINDGYLGSGKLLRRAIDKYGVENFSREILESFSTECEMYEAERLYVSEEWLASDNVYNIILSGKGGWGHIDVSGENNPFFGKEHTDESKKKMRETTLGRYVGKNNPMFGVKLTRNTNGMFGKCHTENAKQKMRGKRPNGRYNNPKSNSHKKALSESAKKRWSNPEERKRASVKSKNRKPISEDTIEKMRTSQIERRKKERQEKD